MVLHQYSTSTLVQYRGGVPVQRETLLTCLSCNPCAQILSSRSQRPCMRVFSCSPAILASPWPCSIPWPPILSTSIRLVCTHTHTHTQSSSWTEHQLYLSMSTHYEARPKVECKRRWEGTYLQTTLPQQPLHKVPVGLSDSQGGGVQQRGLLQVLPSQCVLLLDEPRMRHR